MLATAGGIGSGSGGQASPHLGTQNCPLHLLFHLSLFSMPVLSWVGSLAPWPCGSMSLYLFETIHLALKAVGWGLCLQPVSWG